MNEKLFFLGLLQLFLSLFLGVIILYLNYRVLYRYLGKKFGVNESNLAFALLVSGLLFSVGYLMAGILQPTLTTLRLLSQQLESTQDLLLASSRHIFTFLLIGMLVSLLINITSVSFYTALTKVKEFEEIGKNNVAVGLVTAVIVLTMTFLVKDSMVLMIEAFIPYPEGPNIF